MNIPLWTGCHQNKRYGEKIKQKIAAVIDRGRFILSNEVKTFEERICRYTGAGHAIGVASGSDALFLSLLALDFAPGSQIITTPYTFFASTSCIIRNQLEPVFVDVDYHQFNLDWRKIEAAVTTKTRAILTVDLFSHMPDYDRIQAIAQKHSLIVIEDSAEGFGMRWNGKAAGRWGKAGVFSFFPSKTLGAFGDGGMIITDDDQIAARIKCLRAHGAKPKYHHPVVGINSRLDELQAAVLNVKLDYVDQEIAERAALVKIYFERLQALPDVVLPQIEKGAQPVWYVFTVKCQKRDQLRQYLADHHIQTEIYYPIPMHLQECLRYLNYQPGDFPIAEQLAALSLSLPLFPGLKPQECHYVCDVIEKFYQGSTFQL